MFHGIGIHPVPYPHARGWSGPSTRFPDSAGGTDLILDLTPHGLVLAVEGANCRIEILSRSREIRSKLLQYIIPV